MVESYSPVHTMISDTCAQSDSSGDQTNRIRKTSIRSNSPTQQQQQQSTNDSSCSDNCPLQSIRFGPFHQQNWHALCDQSLQEL